MPDGSPLEDGRCGEAIPHVPMRFPTLVTVLLAAVVCHGSGSAGLTSAPPYSGMSLAPAFSISVEGPRAEWAEFSRGRPLRKGVLNDGVAPARWRLRYDPAGTAEWLVVNEGGVVVQRAKFEGLGPFVGRMPAALKLESAEPGLEVTFDGVAVATESGSTGTRYLTGPASPFELAGPVPNGRVTILLLGTKSDTVGVSLLPLAAAGVLSANTAETTDPVPEPSSMCALAAAVGIALRKKLSGRQARSAGRLRRAFAARTRR